MKIVVISSLDGDITRGPNNSVPNQVHNLNKVSGVDILWINISDEPIRLWENSTNFYSINSYIKAMSIINEYSPDLVMFQQVYHFSYYLIFTKIRKKKIPYVIIPRSSLTYSAQKRHNIKKGMGNLLFFNRFIKEAQAIHFLTKSEHVESKKFKFKNYYIIPNGIDDYNIEKKYFSQSSLSAVFIGRLEKFQKGLDLLVNAISMVKHDLRNNSFILNIYGPNIDATGSYLKTFIKDNDLRDLIIVNDSISGKEKIQVLEKSDIFILTSRFEGLSMGLLEALSFGVPVMITKGTNFTDEVQEYNAGWIAENNEVSISQALLAIIKDKANLECKSLSAKKLAKKYSWELISNETIKILTNLISE